MNILVMNSFSDNQSVKKSLAQTSNKYKNIKFYKLNKVSSLLWKIYFKYYLKRSDLIILYVGSSTYESNNIAWELKKAQQYSKNIYVIKLFNKAILPKNYSFTYVGNTLDKILKKIMTDAQTTSNNILFNTFDKSSIEEKKILLEEYKLMVQSSEALIARRQTTNTFFVAINGSLFSLFGLIITKINNAIILVIPIVGILLCWHWRKLIISYGQLNSGKFSVITKLETYLPVSIFLAEWYALGEGKNPSRYKSFTTLEKDLPLIVAIIYFLSIVAYLYYIFFFNVHYCKATPLLNLFYSQ